MRVYNGLLNAMEQNLWLPALGTMSCCVFSQIKVRQVRAAHRFVVIFAHGRAGELLFAILLAALLLLIPLARVEHRWPAVQHVHRLVVHPCSEEQLPIRGNMGTFKRMALDGATGGAPVFLNNAPGGGAALDTLFARRVPQQ